MLLLNALPGGQIGPWRADIPGVTDGCVGWDKDQTNADDWREFSSLHVGITIDKSCGLALCFVHAYLPLTLLLLWYRYLHAVINMARAVSSVFVHCSQLPTFAWDAHI